MSDTESESCPPEPCPPRSHYPEDQLGRAIRRAICDRITGGKPLYREAGDPRKDAILRQMNSGERGVPFAEFPSSPNDESGSQEARKGSQKEPVAPASFPGFQIPNPGS